MMIHEKSIDSGRQLEFMGFEPLDANFIFCPNQFFDLVVPNQSRSVVRLVAYILFQTLRWLDKNGQPINQDISVSFNDLVSKAGISRGSIRKAIALAVDAGLVECVSKGMSKSAGQPGRVGEYKLCWDDSGAYAKSVSAFKGFYIGQGNRSPIPHSFFSHVIPQEPLAVVKLVATVLRHTIGYQNQLGTGRRLEAHLSFKMIHRYARISSPNVLSDAIKHAINSQYIRRVERGQFTFDNSQQKAAVYAVNWQAVDNLDSDFSKTVAADRFKKSSSASVQKPKQQQFKNHTGNGSENVVGDQFKNCSTLKNSKKETNKQLAVAAVDQDAVGLLQDAGFDALASAKIAAQSDFEQIKNQIAWLQYRESSKNPLGMLRTAIIERWNEPNISVKKRQAADQIRRQKHIDEQQMQKQQDADSERQLWLSRWHAAPHDIRRRCKEQALAAESNPIVRNRLVDKSLEANPHPCFMLAFREQSKMNGPNNSMSA